MFFLVIVLYLAQALAYPLASTSAVYEPSSSVYSCHDIGKCRTIGGIISSCLVTIFSCTWVAVHPNIPSPKRQHPIIKFASNRMLLFVLALLVPEYILAWSIRQRLRAREITRQHEGLTTTHAFFVIMGGFHVFKRAGPPEDDYPTALVAEDSIPLHPLSIDDLDPEIYEFNIPTVDDIRDKSKSDWLAKSLVIVQTTWFVVQCIARAVGRLPITELELVTIAYAASSLAMYVAWWDKPLNVWTPVKVHRRDGKASHSEPQLYPSSKDWFDTAVDYIAGNQDDNVNLAKRDAVPIFWSDSDGEQAINAASITLAFGIVFGSIHCAAWYFPFPSPQAQMLWRISAIGITTIPGLLMASGGAYSMLPDNNWHGLLSRFVAYVTYAIFVITMFLSPLVYIMARGTTLGLAFLELGSLNPGAYETVQWTTFLPHFQVSSFISRR